VFQAYKVTQKRKPLASHQSIVLMLSLGIIYSMRDLICDVIYCAWGAKLRYASYNAIDISATSFI